MKTFAFGREAFPIFPPRNISQTILLSIFFWIQKRSLTYVLREAVAKRTARQVWGQWGQSQLSYAWSEESYFLPWRNRTLPFFLWLQESILVIGRMKFLFSLAAGLFNKGSSMYVFMPELNRQINVEKCNKELAAFDQQWKPYRNLLIEHI